MLRQDLEVGLADLPNRMLIHAAKRQVKCVNDIKDLAGGHDHVYHPAKARTSAGV